MKYSGKKLSLVFSLVALLALVVVTPAYAQEGGPPAADVALDLNTMWLLICGFIVFFMQAGFALVETGFTRNKNVAHTMMMNMMVFCIGALAYYAVGFGLQFGGLNYTFPAINGYDAWAFSPVTLGDWTGVLDKPLLIGNSSIM